MISEGEFWIKFWTLVTVVLVTVIVTLFMYSKHESTLKMEAWNNCVSAGGQPMSQPILGSQSTTFTCVRK